MIDLRSRIVPNYELAPDLQNIEILRVVVRENTSEVVSLDSMNDSIYSAHRSQLHH